MEVEATAEHKQCRLAPWAMLLGMSHHTAKVAGRAGYQHKRN